MSKQEKASTTGFKRNLFIGFAAISLAIIVAVLVQKGYINIDDTNQQVKDLFQPNFQSNSTISDNGLLCPVKPNPPCGSKQDGEEIASTTAGVLTYEGCPCPEGTYDSGERDAITTPNTTYIICMCDS